MTDHYTPILPPLRSELAAYLKAGDKLVHRDTMQTHTVDRVDCVRTHLTRPVADGIHHIDGTTLAIKIGDRIYAEYGHTPIARIWEDYYCFEHERIAFIDMMQEQRLDTMQCAGRFWFYRGQRDLLLQVDRMTGALIAVETGGGKTLIGIALAYLKRVDRCLILVPQGVLQQWVDEFAKFWPGQGVKRLTAGAIRDSRIPNGIWLAYHEEFLLNAGGFISQLAPDAFDMVILDEGHLRQDPDTTMGDRLWQLTPRLRYVLTATPIPNRIGDIYPICRWIRPDLTFRYNHQREWIELDGGGRKELEPTVPLSPSLFAMELKRIVVAVRKVDLRPDMPWLELQVHRVEMGGAQRQAYDALEQWCPERGDGGTVVRLRQARQRNVCADPGERNEAVLKRIMEIALNGDQVVVGCARTGQTTWLAHHLRDAGIKFARIDSLVPASAHAEQAARFKAGLCNVLLIGVRCAYGYSFPECSHGILASPEWGYGTVAQFLGRFYRLNSVDQVTCDIYICRDTIEEPMVDNLGLKESAANSILFGPEVRSDITVAAQLPA